MAPPAWPDTATASAAGASSIGCAAAIGTASPPIEYAARGVRVNAVSPRSHHDAYARPASYEGMAGVYPRGRMGEISDIVDGILYLEQATFGTGETLHIDGGQAARLTTPPE
jgi:NAD(P)-dependent dehydrogenase (short-subunit alcohol dehydrogenase family)